MDLMSILPDFYYENDTMTELQDILSGMTDSAEAALAKVIDEKFINTASDTLERREVILGLTVQKNQSLATRREKIKAKLLSSGTTTVEMIKEICEQFSNGAVDVTEDNSNYNVIITFVGTIGVPPGLQELEKAVRQIIPAHLSVNYVYIYNTYNSFEKYTYGELEPYTNDQLRNMKIEG